MQAAKSVSLHRKEGTKRGFFFLSLFFCNVWDVESRGGGPFHILSSVKRGTLQARWEIAVLVTWKRKMNMCCRCNKNDGGGKKGTHLRACTIIYTQFATSKERETVCGGKLLFFQRHCSSSQRKKREREATTLGFPLDKSASKMSDHSSSFFSLEFTLRHSWYVYKCREGD